MIDQPAYPVLGGNTAEVVKHRVKSKQIPNRADQAYTSRAGQAKAFVEKRLSGIEFIVIKTSKTDMYGRYVADACYHPTRKDKEKVYIKGFFLNSKILAEGLADIV